MDYLDYPTIIGILHNTSPFLVLNGMGKWRCSQLRQDACVVNLRSSVDSPSNPGKGNRTTRTGMGAEHTGVI